MVPRLIGPATSPRITPQMKNHWNHEEICHETLTPRRVNRCANTAIASKIGTQLGREARQQSAQRMQLPAVASQLAIFPSTAATGPDNLIEAGADGQDGAGRLLRRILLGHALLDVSSQRHECLLDVGRVLGTGFDKRDAQLVRVCLRAGSLTARGIQKGRKGRLSCASCADSGLTADHTASHMSQGALRGHLYDS